MQEIVGELCRARGFRISAAESCTGGLVMARLTEVPGSSDYVDRGVVVYSNQSKTDLLGVPADLIEQHGAVSEPVAEAMARGMVKSRGHRSRRRHHRRGRARRRHTRETGRHGRRRGGLGATERDRDARAHFKFVGGREMVRFQASQAALDMVRRWLTEET